MTSQYLDIETISGLHNYVGAPGPRHPLISLIDNTRFYAQCPRALTAFRFGFYTISCKRIHGVLKYGKGHYDFSEGSLMFTAPWQVITGSIEETGVEEGWALFIHPDLLNATELGKKMHQYSFFNYDVKEALHISEDEKQVIRDCVDKIEREYSQNIDKHTLRLITGNIELLLNYCERFYDRQFYTRAKVSNDLVQHFERLLNDYFAKETLIETGLPSVRYFASELNLSPNYLSDLLNRFTGKTTQEHIHLRLIDKAKSLLWGTEQSISEIAYDLGFEHPSHFTKIFKTKTGKSPSAFRNLN